MEDLSIRTNQDTLDFQLDYVKGTIVKNANAKILLIILERHQEGFIHVI